jgi:hypothetical protein
MKKLFLLLSVSTAITAYADIDRSKKPEADPAPAVSFPDYRTEVLPNGLRSS